MAGKRTFLILILNRNLGELLRRGLSTYRCSYYIVCWIFVGLCFWVSVCVVLASALARVIAPMYSFWGPTLDVSMIVFGMLV